MTYFHAAHVAERRFEKDFPGITVTIRPIHSERVIEVTWTDGPTATQVENSLNPHVGIPLRLYRHISPDFRALLADDIELGADPGHENEDSASRIARLARTTSVDGERCVWSVPA